MENVVSAEFLSLSALACSAGVFFERAICSRKRHVETSGREEEMGRVKIKDSGYNNITNRNKVSPGLWAPGIL